MQQIVPLYETLPLVRDPQSDGQNATPLWGLCNDPHTSPGGGAGEVAGCNPTSSGDLGVFTDPGNGMSIDIQKVSACRHYSLRKPSPSCLVAQNTES